MPINAKIESKFDIELEAVSAKRVLSAMEPVTEGVRILLLDACRNSPYKSFTRSNQSGLAIMEDVQGTIIGYATGPGKLASDGSGNNSPYIEGLVKSINEPNLTIEAVFKKTRKWVKEATNGTQIPWETSSFLLGLSDKITKIYGFCNVCGLEATKTFRKIKGGNRTQVGAANIYEPRCLKHWKPR